MLLEIITPEKVLYSNNIKLVQLPGVKGSFEILKNHASIISALTEGIVRVIDSGENELSFKISEGVVECKLNNVYVLANNAVQIIG